MLVHNRTAKISQVQLKKKLIAYLKFNPKRYYNFSKF